MARKEIRLEREARDDLKSAVRWSRKRFGSEQARRFRRDLENAFALLASQPEMGHALEFDDLRHQDFLSWPVPGYPQLIYYRNTESAVLVVAVWDGRMDLEAAIEERFGNN